MNPPELKPQAKTAEELPSWEQLTPARQQELIRILSEMIRRQVKQEVPDEPHQD